MTIVENKKAIDRTETVNRIRASKTPIMIYAARRAIGSFVTIYRPTFESFEVKFSQAEWVSVQIQVIVPLKKKRVSPIYSLDEVLYVALVAVYSPTSARPNE